VKFFIGAGLGTKTLLNRFWGLLCGIGVVYLPDNFYDFQFLKNLSVHCELTVRSQ